MDASTPARRGERPAEELARKLDRPMGALGLVFVVVLTGQLLATNPQWSRVFTVIGWIFWAAFAGEFALRAYVAKDQRRFWRRNWWQLIFLAIPFLRLLRGLALLRSARVAGVVSATVRGSRSAGRLLTGRIGWLATFTTVVIVGASQFLFAAGTYSEYGTALHDAALATITGEPLGADGAVARWTEVVLAIYSVAIFATLAGSLGAFFLRPDREPRTAPNPTS
ncbi:MAG TPA: hypothetical protein VIR30_18775 [Nocardioides sp.]